MWYSHALPRPKRLFLWRQAQTSALFLHVSTIISVSICQKSCMVHGPMSYGSPSRGPPHLRARSDPPKTLREAAESGDELPLPSPSRPSEPRVATSPARGRAERSPKGVHDGSCRLVVGRFTVAQGLIFDQPGCFEPCQLLGKHQHVPASEPFLYLLFWSVTFQDCCSELCWPMQGQCHNP